MNRACFSLSLCAVLLLSAAGLVVASASSALPEGEPDRKASNLREVKIDGPADTPLQVIAPRVQGDSFSVKNLQAIIKNTGSSRITGYTLEWQVIAGGKAYTLFTTADYSKSLDGKLKPGETDSVSPPEFEAVLSLPSAIEGVSVKIDYVEAEDGTSYGPDLSNTALKLRLKRSGAELERQRLLHLLEAHGLDALLNELTKQR